jgi:hypothetical protein
MATVECKEREEASTPPGTTTNHRTVGGTGTLESINTSKSNRGVVDPLHGSR